MKKIALFTSILAFISVMSFAQVSEGDIQLFQNYFGVQKMELVKEYMTLSPEEDATFWPLYDAYETERQEIIKGKFKLVEEYVNTAVDISETQATSLVDQNIAYQNEFFKLQKTYFKKMSKSVGSVKAAQFYQLESYLNNVITLLFQESIPFVGQLEQLHDKN